MPDPVSAENDPYDRVPLPENASDADMEPWRQRIDELDREILKLLNERVHCADVIGAIKKQLGLPVYVPSRESEVIANVREANKGPLDAAAVQRVFERIIDETRSLERRHYQKSGGATPAPRERS
jgi:chorismate mutase